MAGVLKCDWIPVPRNWQKLKPHILSAIVDFGAGIDVSALAEHMREFGYDIDEPVILYESEILDGRHKLAAAIIAGVTPSFKKFVGQSPEAFVAKKAHRQHLNASQRAMLAAAMTNSERGAKKKSGVTTQGDASKTMNVSGSSTARAAKVTEKGTESLQSAVKDGTLAVGDAAKVADEPAAVQDQAVKDVKEGKASTASEAVKNKKKPKQGKPAFDDRKIIGRITELAKLVDARGEVYKDRREKQACLDSLDAFLTRFYQWQAKREGKG